MTNSHIVDFLGQLLQIGDTVVFSYERGKDLRTAKVEAFVIKPKSTKVLVRWAPRHDEKYDFGSMKIDPKFTVKVPPP